MFLTSFSAFPNSSADKLDMVNDIIDSNIVSIDNYHYGRIKGYLEGLNLEKEFILKSTLTEMDYRMNLVVLKSVLNNVQAK